MRRVASASLALLPSLSHRSVLLSLSYGMLLCRISLNVDRAYKKHFTCPNCLIRVTARIPSVSWSKKFKLFSPHFEGMPSPRPQHNLKQLRSTTLALRTRDVRNRPTLDTRQKKRTRRPTIMQKHHSQTIQRNSQVIRQISRTAELRSSFPSTDHAAS